MEVYTLLVLSHSAKIAPAGRYCLTVLYDTILLCRRNVYGGPGATEQ